MAQKRMPLPWENVPRVCRNCGYHGVGKNLEYRFFGLSGVIKCPKCGKRKFVKDPAVVF